jgi:centrosomal protein CEP290
LLFILNSKSEQKTNENQSELSSSSQPNRVITSSSDNDPETFLLIQQIKSLKDENETLKLNLERTDLLKAQYEELVRTSELSDDDKHKFLVNSLERCHQFESNLVFYERKFKFLLEENDKLNVEIRALKVASIELKTDLKMEALEKSSIVIEETSENSNELFNIQLELQQVRTELNGFCTNILKNIKSLDEENILQIDTEKLSQIAILEPNLSTNFITRNEFDALAFNLSRMQETIKAHEAKEKHFEEIAKVAQQQLKSQQLMLSQFSDDEIVARHLIVDLQSQSNENYLLAKTVRDLKVGKFYFKIKINKNSLLFRLPRIMRIV